MSLSYAPFPVLANQDYKESTSLLRKHPYLAEYAPDRVLFGKIKPPLPLF